jgi:hypothetical protein
MHVNVHISVLCMHMFALLLYACTLIFMLDVIVFILQQQCYNLLLHLFWIIVLLLGHRESTMCVAHCIYIFGSCKANYAKGGSIFLSCIWSQTETVMHSDSSQIVEEWKKKLKDCIIQEGISPNRVKQGVGKP